VRRDWSGNAVRDATRIPRQSRGLEPLVDWIGIYGEFWHSRFAKLKELLKQMDL
jgi:hypothetical protein